MNNPLLSRFLVIYGPPTDTPDPTAFFGEMSRLMKGYSPAELDKAADLAIRSNKRRGWPPVNEILTACEDARQLLTPRKEFAETHKDWSADAFKFSRNALDSPLGRRAAEEGWIGTLDTFLRQRRTLPTAAEEVRLKREARQFDEALAACISKRAGVLSAPLEKLGTALLDRRNRLTDKVLHGVVE